MTRAEQFRKLMQVHGITYAELGKELDRTPNTVKQRITTESTFHKHLDTYMEALNNCVERKEKAKEKALRELKS